MVIFDTLEMDKLFNKVEPYLNKHMELSEDAPEDVKQASEEYQRLARERMEFAYSM